MKVRNLAALALFVLVSAVFGSEVKVEYPLDRAAYQTNEYIPLAIARKSNEPLAAGDLVLTVAGTNASKLTFKFQVRGAPVADGSALAVEHIYLNGWLLRPGKYSIDVSVDGATSSRALEICSHVRKTTFVLADWGSRAGEGEQILLGELGFNLNLAAYGGIHVEEMVRGGVNYMRCCTMGGAHQMDLRMECDWSDPYVLHGSQARVVRQAFADRTSGNCVGVHFYDEPGLTWWKDPKTDQMTPHNIPAQDRAFKAAYGKDPLHYSDVKPDSLESTEQWNYWGRWKESFMDAAWKYSSHAVNEVRPDFLGITQSVYGWSAYADGYYWPITRSLPIVCGHGGYDDLLYGYMYPSFTFEFGRMRDLSKPNWYLPMWYGGMPSDHFRAEQYLSFMNNLQGMMKPPDHTVHKPSTAANTIDGVVESNRLMARLGTVFEHMPVTRPPTAVLYSLSQCLYAQARDMNDNYNGGNQRNALEWIYLASKLTQIPLFPIVDEDVLDGTLALHHKAVVLGGVDYLDPKVASALETFIVNGGTVIVSDDSKLTLKGAVKLGQAVDYSFNKQMSELWKSRNFDELHQLEVAPEFFKRAMPIAQALKTKLTAAGIEPVLESDCATIAASRQGQGDIEYFFAVNMTPDADRIGKNNLKPAVATLSLPDNGRPLYDAVLGGPAQAFEKADKKLTAKFRFGPGEMRVFARTARPIGSVQALTPTVVRDLTLAKDPIRLEVSAALADDKGKILAGAAPLRIRVVDPLGVTRYDLFRATDKGVYKETLTLAANDAVGAWKVQVQELLNNTEDSAAFEYAVAPTCAAISGSVPRAVSFGNDRDNIYRFFRRYHDVTIVTGSSDFDAVAADRLVEVLKPWDVRCVVVKAADVNKPRQLSDVESKTWTGLNGGTRKPADANIGNVGFDVRGPVILVGNPDDNPLIKFAHEQKFLPFGMAKDTFPGRARGYIAWQLDAVGYSQESVAVMAYDAEGMSEAVGTMYEAATGLNPLMPLNPPVENTVAPAGKAETFPAPVLAWQLQMPDRAAALKALADGKALVLTQDGTLAQIDATGKTLWKTEIDGGEAWDLDASKDGKFIVVGASHHALGFDASGAKLFDLPLRYKDPGAPKEATAPQTFVAVSPDGARALVGTRNGKLFAVDASGKQAWIVGGVSETTFGTYETDLKTWNDGAKERTDLQNAFKAATASWKTEMAAWDAGAKDRDAAMAEFRKAQAEYKTALATWNKTKTGDKPAEPKKPELAEKPAQPKPPKLAPQPLRPKPEPYLAASFSADGKTIVATTAREIVALNAETGAETAKEPGAKGLLVPANAPNLFYVPDGNTRVALYSAEAGKTIHQVTLTHMVMDPRQKKPVPQGVGANVVAPLGDGVLVAGENDQTLYALKAMDGDAKSQNAWTYNDPLRQVKFLAPKGGLVAVAYWGGHLNVLDAATGAVKYQDTLPQDAAAMVWLGDNLVIALADGRIRALDVK